MNETSATDGPSIGQPVATAVVSLHAHPDDEVMLTGQFLAKAAEQGLRTIVVYGTRGDAGRTDLDLGDETLGERRADEARRACAELGVHRVEFLDYLDSGMAGSEDNHHPQAFSNADPVAVAAEVAALLGDEHIYAVVGYDANGTYGHPDHLQVYRVAHALAPLIGAPWLLDATYNRDYLATLPDSDGSLDLSFASAERDLTHFVQGERWFRAKMEGVKQHKSQVRANDDTGTNDDTDTEKPPRRTIDGWRARFGTEWFVAKSLDSDGASPAPLGPLNQVLEPKGQWPGPLLRQR